MLGNIAENRADNLREFMWTFWLTENLRDYLSENRYRVTGL